MRDGSFSRAGHLGSIRISAALRWPALTIAALAATITPGLVLGQEGAGEPPQVPPRPIQTHRVTPTDAEIDLDGVLDEPAWAEATRVTLPFEWLPGDNTPAPVDTECFVTYGSANLYLACRAQDPDPGSIRAHVADRDTPFADDHLVFLLDTFNDQRRAFQFRVNPYGVQMDAILSQGFEDFSWDTIWDSAGRITQEGYVVEVAIPFKSLAFQPTATEQTWGFIVDRSYPRSVRHRIRNSWTDRDDPCLLCQADRLVGFRGVRPGRDLELTPTLTTSRTDRREDLSAGELERGDIDAEAGLFVEWGVTPNLGLSGTVNPDFSQVEADVAQLEVNERFALFFPEKRPFFLEGADLFDVSGDLVFTRTVVDPIAGGKLVGKLGRNAIGVFVTRDKVNSLVFPGLEFSRRTLLDDDVTGAVARYRRDIGASSTLGLLYTGREADGYHNRLIAADGLLRLSRSNSVRFIVAHSRTEYPDSIAAAFSQPEGEFSAEGYSAEFQHSSRNVFAEVSWRDVEGRLRADAGFLPQVGQRGPEGALAYTFWGDAGKWFNHIRIRASGERLEDEDGELSEQILETNVSYSGPLQSEAAIETSWIKQRFAGETFDLRRYFAFTSLRPSGDVELQIRAQFGDDIDFENVRKANIFRLSPGLELKLGPRVEWDLSHTLERLSLAGERIFLANLFQTRFVYHFSQRAFVRGILQLRDLDRNLELYANPVEESTQAVFTQFLFSYEVNPRTVLFAGYSDNRLGLTDVDMTTTDRSFFLKLGYAWRP